MEDVVAERLSYLAETDNSLAENPFGARKHRSTTQALIIRQESIYDVWRDGNRESPSLVRAWRQVESPIPGKAILPLNIRHPCLLSSHVINPRAIWLDFLAL